jgi:probable F420-dependent oxidoreductase
MRFGVALPTYPAGATVDGVVAVARAAERLGFGSVWTTDHVVMLPGEAGPYAEILEPMMVMAYLAAVTERVTIGASVIVVPQRNGIVLAKEIATLDHLCRGRLAIGVGAGWNEAEFHMLGYGERFQRRGAFLDETLRVWTHLFTQPEQPFQGRFYDLPPVAFAPPPLQPGGPPIWVGGASEGAIRRTGRYADVWHPVGIAADAMAQGAERLRQAAAAAGRATPRIVPRLPMEFGETPGAVFGRNRPLRAEPAEMIERLRPYAAAGADEIICAFGSPDGAFTVAQMERFAAEVMPGVG